jgi:hypothetical protein
MRTPASLRAGLPPTDPTDAKGAKYNRRYAAAEECAKPSEQIADLFMSALEARPAETLN